MSPAALRFEDLGIGTSITPFDLHVTPTVIVAGAIASRDFMPAHHDRDFATAQHAPDIFMNILTTNGYVSRFVTDWAGPRARVQKIAIRLGAPAIPGHVLQFRGEVTETQPRAERGGVELAIRVTCDLGEHATGTVILTLPLEPEGRRAS